MYHDGGKDVRVFPTRRDWNRFMATLYGYFDESGKSHEQEVVVFSGFVTTWRHWENLGEEWKRLLRVHGLKALHFTEQKRRTSILKKFINVIKSEVEYGISYSVKVDGFNALPEILREKIGGDPHYLAFKMVVFKIIGRMAQDPGSILNFTCDEDEATTLQCYRWYKEIKRDRADMREKLASFCVADDRHFPQLQASDLFAALNRAEAERRMLGASGDVQDLFDFLKEPEFNCRLTFEAYHFDETNLEVLLSGWEEEVRKALANERDSDIIDA